MKAKDVELYQHSLRVQSLALAFTKTVLHLPKAETLRLDWPHFSTTLVKCTSAKPYYTKRQV